MTKLQKFLLNGQQYSIKQKISLSDLIDYFNYDKFLLVLEYNDVICNKKNWENIYIKHQDKIEIVTIVGGG
jgi:sulfur carrier protein